MVPDEITVAAPEGAPTPAATPATPEPPARPPRIEEVIAAQQRAGFADPPTPAEPKPESELPPRVPKGEEGAGQFTRAEEAPETPEEPEKPEKPEKPAAEPEAEVEEPEEFLVKLPARRPDEPEEEWSVTDRDLAERIRQLANGYRRREEVETVRADVEAREERLALVEEQLTSDPEVFIGERLKPELREAVALSILLSDDALYERLLTKIAEWDANPVKRAEDRLAHKERLIETRSQRQIERVRHEQTVRAVQVVNSAIETFIPTAMSEDDATAFSEDAKEAISVWIERDRRANGGRTTFSVDKIPTILARLFRVYGMDGKPKKAVPGGRPASANGRSDPASADAVARAKATGDQLRKASAARKALTTSPAGAGAAPTPATPPKGQTIKERVEWLASRPSG